MQGKSAASKPSAAIIPPACPKCQVIILTVFLAQEKDADLALKSDESTVDDELTPEGQEDDGDWEQVGPRNKSMVTRMVRCRVNLITFLKL